MYEFNDVSLPEGQGRRSYKRLMCSWLPHPNDTQQTNAPPTHPLHTATPFTSKPLREVAAVWMSELFLAIAYEQVSVVTETKLKTRAIRNSVKSISLPNLTQQKLANRHT